MVDLERQVVLVHRGSVLAAQSLPLEGLVTDALFAAALAEDSGGR